MKWSHLPLPGGLYEQHPDLLDQFTYIFSERNKYEAEKQEKERKEQEQKQRQATSKGAARPAGTRRRR